VTAKDWDASRDPRPMLKALVEPPARTAATCARASVARIDHLITDPRSRAALDFADAHLNRLNDKPRGVVKVHKAAKAAWGEIYNDMFRYTDARSSECMVRSGAADAAAQLLDPDPAWAAEYASSFACHVVAWGLHAAAGLSVRDSSITDDEKAGELAVQADLLRCIFGNPFREVRFDPAWRTDTAVALAKHADATNDFTALPILADALQDAGCECEEVLRHCRAAGAHARGCWVCDLVLVGRG
jgi:hypothetical protein